MRSRFLIQTCVCVCVFDETFISKLDWFRVVVVVNLAKFAFKI